MSYEPLFETNHHHFSSPATIECLSDTTVFTVDQTPPVCVSQLDQVTIMLPNQNERSDYDFQLHGLPSLAMSELRDMADIHTNCLQAIAEDADDLDVDIDDDDDDDDIFLEDDDDDDLLDDEDDLDVEDDDDD